jgi:protein TonB
MERPQHALKSVQTKSPQARFFSIAIVAGIHVIIIFALIIGLTNNELKKKIVDISASVVEKKEQPKPPPPPPPAMKLPPPIASAPPPTITISAPPPPPAPAPPKAVAAPPPPPPPPTELKQITRTHTLPPYPALSQRMGEQGTTRLKVVIGTDGKVTECSVDKSSGSTRLDEAAVSYVKDHWTWQPPTQLGKPVTATTLVDVVWDLKNAQ